jgi:hypothetical protein
VRVWELIDKLQKVKDKSKEVGVINFEDSDPLKSHSVDHYDYDDGFTLYINMNK